MEVRHLETRLDSRCAALWTARCNATTPPIKGKLISTWQSIENEPEDILHDDSDKKPKAKIPVQPRYIDYKNDNYDMGSDDNLFLNSSLVSDSDKSDDSTFEKDNGSISGNSYGNDDYEHVQNNINDLLSSDSNTERNNNYIYGVEDQIIPRRQLNNSTDKPLETVEVTRRQVVSIKPQIRRKSCPEPAPEMSKSLSLSKDIAVDDSDVKEAARLKDVWAEARSMSRPMSKSKTIDMSDVPVEHKKYNFISVNQPRIVEKAASTGDEEEGEEQPKTDFEVLSHITALTRKATRPKLKDLDLQPKTKPTRTRSVAQVSSPTVPALSPASERHSTRNRSFSSSGSSVSEFPFYHQEIDPCFKCGKTVYQLDKVGPIRKTLFHKQCFRCFVCNTSLTVKNYCQNFKDKLDLKIYCRAHQPSQEKAHVSIADKNISVVLDYPKLDRVNNTIRGPDEERRKYVNSDTLALRGAMTTPKLDMVFKQWGDVNKTYLDSIANCPVGGRDGDLLRVSDVEAKTVWSRSAMGAASLDLGTPNPRRNIHHFYSYKAGHMNNL